MDSTLHVLSGCQCPVICNMVIERLSIARMDLKVVSEGSYGSSLVHMDEGSTDRLAQHDLRLHIIEQVSLCAIPPRNIGVHTSLAPAFLIKLDVPPATPMLSWSLLALITQIDHLLPPHIGYSAV
eukprot:1145545-Pelagomonas_calceolata.AAC.3